MLAPYGTDGARARRRAPSRALIVLVVLAAALLVPRAALAFCRAAACVPSGIGRVCTPKEADETPDCGVLLAWKERCIGYSIQRDGSKLIAADAAATLVGQAFDAWTNAPCGGGRPSIVVKRNPDASCASPEYNFESGNANVFMFRDDGWPYENADDILGVATLWYDVNTGEVFDVDVEINTTDYTFTTGDTDVGFDLLATLQHEAGHFLGLAHSQFDGSVMAPTPYEGSLQGRELSHDDIEAICRLYPPNDTPVDPACAPVPRNFSPDCLKDQGKRAPDAEGPDDGGCSLAPVRGRPPEGSMALVAGALVVAGVRRGRRRAARSNAASCLPSCSAGVCADSFWRDAVRAGRYGDVVVVPAGRKIG